VGQELILGVCQIFISVHLDEKLVMKLSMLTFTLLSSFKLELNYSTKLCDLVV
jgi:hypothetical protein